MKTKIQNVLTIKMELDSSEMVMMNKGGRFHTEIPAHLLQTEIEDEDYEDDTVSVLIEKTKIIFSVQMPPQCQGRFDHVTAKVKTYEEFKTEKENIKQASSD